MVSREPPRFILDYVPIARPIVKSMRGGTSFWVLAGRGGVRSSILTVPITYPPEEVPPHMAAALLAWAAGRFFFETQRNGELELLLSTPLGARDIIGGNWRALCKPLRGAWLLVGFLILLELLMGPHSGLGGALGVFQMAMAPVVRVLDIIALCWVGMWFGLRARKPLYIMGWTVGLVVGFIARVGEHTGQAA